MTKSLLHDEKVKPKTPKVRLARVAGRFLQLRYTDSLTRKEVRISTETNDEGEALAQKKQLEAKLTLGIEVQPRRQRDDGPRMPWDEFRADYSRLKVATFRSDGAKNQAECNIDVCERVINPRTLGDMAKPATLARLQSELLAGAGSNRKETKVRSAHTVRSYMKTLIAALNWAHRPMRWLPEGVDFQVMDADDPDKGRPLVLEEFERLLDCVGKVVPAAEVDSWKHLLRGLWESGLRLTEALSLAWDIDGLILPTFPKRGLPTLYIPAKLQKSRKAQDVPTTPGFAALLTETAADQRTGFIFNPGPRRGSQRLLAQQVGKTISAIGAKARIVTNAKGKTASAHDLRRSFGQRMADAGLPPRDLQAIMRHASLTTTEAYYLRDRVQDQAARIAKYLGTVPGPKQQTATAEVAVSR